MKLEAIRDDKFNKLKSRSSNFKFSTLGIKHDGIIYALSSESNSIVILKQEAVEDRNENANGFSIIENTFEIK